jgi:hypothetical protein
VSIVMEKPAFTRDQIVTATSIAKSFGTIRKKAKVAPQFVLESGSPDLVILDYDEYENLYLRLQELEETILLERLERLEKNPSEAIPWRQVRRSKSE